MWSSSSHRQVPTQRSAIPFCQGLWKEVWTAAMFIDCMASRTSSPYFASRSWIRNLGAAPNGNASPQLLDDPSAGRMLREVEMQDTPAIMADDKEAVEDAEGDRWHGEEAHGRNPFP